MTQDIILAAITAVLSAAMFLLARGIWTWTFRFAVNVLGVVGAILSILFALGAALAT